MNRKIFAAICSCLVALLSGQVVINEIVADNFSSDFKDKRGTTPDWIELHNQGPTEINLFDYYLTDASEELTKWKFTENFVIPPGGHAIVFASDQDEFFEGEAHTNFRLGASGEYLALVAPDGETIVDAFSPEFPALKMLQSFGRPDDVAAADLLDQPTPGDANSPAAARPQIVSFKSSVESIAWGESATLRWETSRDVTLSISGVGPVNSHVGEHRFTMRSDGRYSQTINFAAELTYDTRSISTEINPAAVIHDLQANPAIISPGQEVTFRWNVFGGNYPFTLSDDQGFTVDVSATQFAHIPQNVQPGEQRTYTLSITDERGTTSAQISVLFGDQGINFAAWEQENDLPAEDGDSDGLDNFLEYALGSDPRIQTDPPLTLTRDDAGFLNLHHPQNLVAEGAQLILETSFDLVSWNPIFSNLPVSSNFRLVERKLPPGSLISTNHYQNLIPTPLKNHYFRIRAKEPE
ncbi:lamin tail domain-containing protein [Akkermansiaceae bacterium]|nr:lamin tail domain-containing protein [Akkermansiaceae bacterium]MDB4299831.1 lamin tail domain-containing protein [bacterium]MDB0056710.1 lamin tail domain-containing protein [Akkermansiaceae bacterium]MDB4141921.1 lamin tail domain-containing protein [Akkermansiaceae bacterium]MDB4541004.1 lamin tail domain-containing protein [Akkermansiaceae bacterium]